MADVYLLPDGTTTNDVGQHIRACIGDLLGTAIGSRLMRRSYGSDLADLVDAPADPGTLMLIQAASVDAVIRWEPRLVDVAAKVSAAASGAVTITVTGTIAQTGDAWRGDVALGVAA